jgi:uncharacterized repeat protein (TIGR03803 family)
MQRLRYLVSGALAFLVAALALSSGGSAATTQGVVYDFTGGVDGGNAATSVAFDPTGRAYVTTVSGGGAGCGTVDRLAPRQGVFVSRTLWTFTCGADGKNPHGGVTLDAAGNIYGTTVAGGSGGVCSGDGCGVVFRIGPHGAFRTLYDFTGGKDGFGPGNAPALDSHGALYGDAPDGGGHGFGVVYQLSFKHRWVLKVIHAFSGGNDGSTGSLGPLLVDAAGDVFGVAELGGRHQAGTVFRITPGADGTWNFDVLYAFKGSPDAGFPYGGLIADSQGDLFGTTYFGGATGNGTVYELVHRSTGTYFERVIYSFTGGSDGANPTSTLVFDAAGDLFGTTSAGGGSCGCGTVFKLDHMTGAETTVHEFGATRTDGAYAYYGLTPDEHGDLFTSTVAGGTFGQGTIFGIVPTQRATKDALRSR